MIYSINLFDLNENNLEKIVHNMTVAEIAHEIMIFASFIPCILIYFYHSPVTFIATSIIVALIDLLYVFIQRYNRPRILKLIQKRHL